MHLEQELGSIRTGRAHPALIENILVESYGARAPLKTVATISTPDPSTLAIQPWDKSIVSSIEKSLREANLGSLPASDGHIIRLSMPSPTEEQRKDLVKKAHEYAEQARISVRTSRSDTHSHLKKLKEGSELTEDDFYQIDKELQHMVDAVNAQIEEKTKAKEKDILTI